VKVELGFEGNTTPVYNSRAVVPNPTPPPPPSITALQPANGPVNWPVTIQGSNFGTTPGSVTFYNNKSAPIVSWIPGTIQVTVPSGAEDGPVTVTTSAGTSPGVTFDVIPPPALSSISPSSAHRNDTVTITGTNFLATQGNSTVTFGTSTASPTSWNNTTIVTPVPADANTGNVVVTVSGQPSNALPFTVIIPGSLGGTITRTSGGTALAGATVQAVLTGIVKGSAISAANGTYSIASLDPGTYDVRITATGFSSELRQGVAITSSSTTTVDVAMSVPGGVSGKITQIDGTTPIVGAAVTVYSGPFQKGSATTNGTGDYTIQALHPGAYTIQAANVGYRTKEQGTVVAENATTTVNLSLDNAVAGPVLYSYDALGRLIQVTDPYGDAAIYRYDAVGNITAIERPTSGGVSISAITPTNGPVGSTVTIYGTGFSSTPAQNTAAFGCGPSCTVNATITSATATRLALTVPATAVTGTIGVTTPGGSASSPTFTVTAAGAAPTLTGFTPTLVATGDTLNVTGTNFDTTPANDRLTTNVAVAQVTSATLTSLQATVPITTTGRVSTNVVQELNAGVPSANLLTGDIDERFVRTVAGGQAEVFLNDVLGSTVALTDGNGAVQTRYDYEPFGATGTEGPNSTNSAQYTGRENDLTSLYYYRARYYAPALHRFISEDPIGFRGGTNLYAYVNNGPLNASDPFGLVAWACKYSIATVNSAPLAGPGAAMLWVECTSECVSGQRVWARLFGSLVGASGGPFPVGATIESTISLRDGFSQPDAQNLAGPVLYASFGGATPWVGWTITTLKLGQAGGHSVGDTRGLDLGLDTYGGLTSLISSRREKCCD
jgi:RHS repeat-associated protein